MSDAQILSQGLIGFRISAAIGTGLLRWLLEGCQMCLERGFPLKLVRRIALEDAVMTDDAAIDFVEPDLVSILHRARFLPATDNIRVRFEDTHHLFVGRYFFSLQDETDGLIDHLLSTRHKSCQGISELFRLSLGLPAQLRLGLERPGHRFSVISSSS